jgi:hypothetical protein
MFVRLLLRVNIRRKTWTAGNAAQTSVQPAPVSTESNAVGFLSPPNAPTDPSNIKGRTEAEGVADNTGA